jgi:2-succinyl-6-hydroxy-2,4-cyclohexadiene-1-carboxylate synthase
MRCALLHGFAGDPSYWDEVIAAWQLPDRPRVIALPGHGGGPVQATWEANLAAVATQIGDCGVIVGYSLGARVALGLVVAKHCNKGVLIGVNPGLDESERAARRASDAAWARMLRERGVGAFDTAWTEQALFATQSRVDSERRAARRSRRLRLDAEQLARSLEVMGVAEIPDYRSELPAHRDQLALIAGADDAKYAAIAQTLPASYVELIADCGHDPTLEQPRELAAAIARAVTRLTAATTM